MGILLFELFRNPLFMGILNKWETLEYNKISFHNKDAYIFNCKSAKRQ